MCGPLDDVRTEALRERLKSKECLERIKMIKEITEAMSWYQGPDSIPPHDPEDDEAGFGTVRRAA